MMQGDLVQHDAGKGQRAAEPLCQNPHWVVGIAGQRGLYEWHIQLYRAEYEHFLVYSPVKPRKPIVYGKEPARQPPILPNSALDAFGPECYNPRLNTIGV